MVHRRLLAVHDISCVGRCSLTVALPIISSMGIECSVLPTAVLSTHTGGFTGFTYRDLTEDIVPIQEHWKSLDLRFGAFYTGFLGSYEQIDIVKDLIDRMKDDDCTVYVDPVMGDVGKLYTVFDSEFPKGMRSLCEKADVLMPNLTELCFMLGMEYRSGPYDWDYIDSVLESAKVFGAKKIVITGVNFDKESVGSVYMDYVTGDKGAIMRPVIEGYYHGTGDVFGSALVGSLESGLSLKDAVRVAVDYTVSSIIRTHGSGADVRYGVDFEEGIKDLVRNVNTLKQGIEYEIVTSDMGIARVAGLAARIWPETFTSILPDGQVEYMVDRYQSPKAIKEQISDGYIYAIIRSGGEDIGYTGFHNESNRTFVSKIYLLPEYRGLARSKRTIEFIRDQSGRNGLNSLYLTVNRENIRAYEAYLHSGFKVIEEVDTPIGNGYEMNDYVMEYRF